MAPAHRYDVINDSDESKGLIRDDDDTREDGHITHEPPQWTQRPSTSSISKSWWKYLLSNLAAAVLGAAVMFAVLRGLNTSQTDKDVSQSTSSPENTPATVTITTTAPADIAIATHPASDSDISPDVEVQVDAGAPNMAYGLVLDCGYSPSEAREKGCVYDVMMQDWVPLPCYDETLTERYLSQGNWTWYTAGDGSTTISLEQMRLGEHGHAWMATSYHKAHCVFSWIKVIRALRNQWGISQELLSYDHVLHCSHGALKAKENDEGLGVRAPTNYAKCALYDTWRGDFIPDKHNATDKRAPEFGRTVGEN